MLSCLFSFSSLLSGWMKHNLLCAAVWMSVSAVVVDCMRFLNTLWSSISAYNPNSSLVWTFLWGVKISGTVLLFGAPSLTQFQTTTWHGAQTAPRGLWPRRLFITDVLPLALRERWPWNTHQRTFNLKRLTSDYSHLRRPHNALINKDTGCTGRACSLYWPMWANKPWQVLPNSNVSRHVNSTESV